MMLEYPIVNKKSIMNFNSLTYEYIFISFHDLIFLVWDFQLKNAES